MINTQIRWIVGYLGRAAAIAAIAGLTLFAVPAAAGEMQVAALSSVHAAEAAIRAVALDRAPPAHNGVRARQGLRLEAMADRLRETDAIGVLKKLAIKSKVDDLARRFGYYHQGQRMADLTELRTRFEVLRSTIVMALKEGDPALAKDIARSGQSLWLAFCDPVLFSKGIGRDIVARNETAADDIGQ